jgi:hypothetical protein
VFDNTQNKGTTLTALLAYRFKVSENRVLRRLFGSKREAITG